MHANSYACVHANANSHSVQCLAACACLIKYVEFVQLSTFASGSLRVEFRSLSGFMHLDVATVAALELTAPSAAAAAAAGGGRRGGGDGKQHAQQQKQSLFAALNHTRTPSGARLLRANLLQPLNDLPTINLRYACMHACACAHAQGCTRHCVCRLDGCCGKRSVHVLCMCLHLHLGHAYACMCACASRLENGTLTLANSLPQTLFRSPFSCSALALHLLYLHLP